MPPELVEGVFEPTNTSSKLTQPLLCLSVNFGEFRDKSHEIDFLLGGSRQSCALVQPVAGRLVVAAVYAVVGGFRNWLVFIFCLVAM